MNYKDKTVIQTYISKDLQEKLKQCAEKENRTLSNLVSVILQEYVESQKSKENI